MAERLFLLFRLAGPMAAFGEITVGERRTLWDAPSKSGVLGIVAACLGIDRTDLTALLALDQSLGFAVRVDKLGIPLRDYHTAQTPKQTARNKRDKAGLPAATRKQDLETDDLNTTLSERFYRLESAATVALWEKPGGTADMDRYQAALKRPVFVPYLGRKSCPLGEPLHPLQVTADGLRAAFDAYDAHNAHNMPLWFELEAGLAEDSLAQEIRIRRDSLRQRQPWHFSDRREGRLPDPITNPQPADSTL